jgi:hypothetical protein
LRGRDVSAPFHGIRSVDLDPASITDRCRMFTPRMHAGDAFCSVTAALLYRMPLPRDLEDDPRLHVTVSDGRHPPRVRGICGHRFTVSRGVWSADGIPVVNPVDTWVQLASLLTAEDLVAVGDFLVSGRVYPGGREPPLSTIAELTSAVGSLRGVRGLAKLRWAAAMVRTGVDSRPESHLRLLFVAKGLPEPAVNPPVYAPSGEFLGRPDLAYLHLKLLFEYEGDYHRTSPAQFRRDISRREHFEEHGWRVMRVTSDDLHTTPRAFVARVIRRSRVHEWPENLGT